MYRNLEENKIMVIPDELYSLSLDTVYVVIEK